MRACRRPQAERQDQPVATNARGADLEAEVAPSPPCRVALLPMKSAAGRTRSPAPRTYDKLGWCPATCNHWTTRLGSWPRRKAAGAVAVAAGSPPEPPARLPPASGARRPARERVRHERATGQPKATRSPTEEGQGEQPEARASGKPPVNRSTSGYDRGTAPPPRTLIGASTLTISAISARPPADPQRPPRRSACTGSSTPIPAPRTYGEAPAAHAKNGSQLSGDDRPRTQGRGRSPLPPPWPRGSAVNARPVPAGTKRRRAGWGDRG